MDSEYAAPQMGTELPRPASKGKGELSGLDITMAENGYSVRCSYEKKNKGQEYPSHTSETKVFESARSLIEFLEETLEG